MKIAGTSLEPLELWRRDVHLRDALGFTRSLAAAALRAGSGAQVTRSGARPEGRLVLYERETCPFSRLVREALSQLDLDALIKPCPEGEQVHRAQLRALSGEEQIPFLVDEGTGTQLGDSRRIVAYLFDRYGAHELPWALRWRAAAERSSQLASAVRGRQIRYAVPSPRPQQPLELWNYEASPYCRIVRERLSELALPHTSHNLARGSARRPAFRERHGKLQFPFLFDPNQGVGMFESARIVRYLDDTYAPGLGLLEAVAQPHLM